MTLHAAQAGATKAPKFSLTEAASLGFKGAAYRGIIRVWLVHKARLVLGLPHLIFPKTAKT